MTGHDRFAGAALLAAILLTLINPAGGVVTQQWDFHHPGPGHGLSSSCGLGLDITRNVYLAGSLWRQGDPSFSFYAMKFNPAGEPLWTSMFSAPGISMSIAEDMVGDPQGNVYITGWCEMSGQVYNYLTAKFNSSGQQQWYATYDGPNHSIDNPVAIAIDETGNVYVTGNSLVASHYDYATVKYSPEGALLWEARYSSPGAANDYTTDVAVDAEGSVYVSGIIGVGNNQDIVTIKYNAQGQEQWVRIYDGSAHLADQSLVIKTDDQGNAYVVGYTTNNNYNYSYLTLKYDSFGILEWAAEYDRPLNTDDVATDLVIDSDGDVTVTGYSGGSGNNTIRYTSQGETVWVREHGYFGEWGYSSAGIALDEDHNVYITSATGAMWFDNACATYKYNDQGDLQWSALYSFDECCEAGSELALDGQGHVLVSGRFVWPEYEYEHPILLKYNQPSGEFTANMIPAVSPVQIPPQGGSFNYTIQLYNTVQNNLRVDLWWKLLYTDSLVATPLTGPEQVILPSGSSSFLRTQRVSAHISAGTYQYILYTGIHPDLIWACDTIPIIKLPANDEALNDCKLHSSPNPFNPSTAISYELRAASFVRLSVYDTAGRIVARLVESTMSTGVHTVHFDGTNLTSGLYLVQMQAGDFTAVQKLMLLK